MEPLELDPGTVAIIQLAWSRVLGFEDTAFADSSTGRLYRTDSNAPVITFVTMFGKEALVGPDWAVAAAQQLPGPVLRQHSTLLTLSREYGGRGLGEAQLFFSDALPDLDPDPSAAVSSEPAFVTQLERLCPPDDSAEAGLSSAEYPFVLLDDSGDGAPRPLSGAGYDVWSGILAHLGVLTPPQHRRRGFAQRIVAVAVEEAMAAGLIPQWRVRTDNTASQRTARRAGFAFAGTQTSVILGA
ncbi:GNAT family N-acetyltransferase [Arthrobacter sp. Br18]|uniref:GNAT family N-acetyltransferase n=1 Tax=Arthrobacter sp. Br18 TaxID=1312954 RepID=UPI0004B88818|nr:GNAT family N-acetyltransferase [Arthrobacter sp. Br18]